MTLTEIPHRENWGRREGAYPLLHTFSFRHLYDSQKAWFRTTVTILDEKLARFCQTLFLRGIFHQRRITRLQTSFVSTLGRISLRTGHGAGENLDGFTRLQCENGNSSQPPPGFKERWLHSGEIVQRITLSYAAKIYPSTLMIYQLP